MHTLSVWSKRIGLGLIVLLLLLFLVVRIWQQFSDGPTGPLAGGAFSSGELVNTPIEDWSVLQGDFEFELVGQGTSRTAGGILVDGTLYITCDLGFIWGRLPSGVQRNLLHVIWLFKDWHEHAVQDGRVVIRKDGRRYPVQITRVADPAEIEQLKTALESLAAEFFAPNDMGPRPTTPPNDIWFFKVANTRGV